MKLTKEIQLPDARQIRVLSEDNRGNLWIGTENAIYQYSLSKGELKKFQGGTNMINGLAVAADGTYSVLQKHWSSNIFLRKEKDIRFGKEKTIHLSSSAPDGKVWVATLEGNVYSYHPQTKVISREENACNTNGDAIKGMEIDDLGHLWILADPYVKEYNPTNHSFRIMYNSDRFIQMVISFPSAKWKTGRFASEGLVLFA